MKKTVIVLITFVGLVYGSPFAWAGRQPAATAQNPGSTLEARIATVEAQLAEIKEQLVRLQLKR